MSPGEGAAHIFNVTRDFRKELEEIVPEEVQKALREAMRPLEKLQNGLKGTRTMIRKQVLSDFPRRKEENIMQRLAEENVSVYQGQPTPGRIAWMVGEQEIMTFEPNGDILVKGRLVENDKAVVDGFREWFTAARGEPHPMTDLLRETRPR